MLLNFSQAGANVMTKILKDNIADIKFSMNRLVCSQIAQEQKESLFLLQKALELLQRAEDSAETVINFDEMHRKNCASVDSLNDLGARAH